MRNTSQPKSLEECRRVLRSCHDELRRLDYILRGSVIRRYMRCGSVACRCHAKEPKLHGPYYDWTRKVRGKTVSTRLTEEQARTVKRWIGNMRRFDRVVSEMEKASARAVDLIRE